MELFAYFGHGAKISSGFWPPVTADVKPPVLQWAHEFERSPGWRQVRSEFAFVSDDQIGYRAGWNQSTWSGFCAMNYAQWNIEIAKKFFSPDSEGKRVFLSATKDLIEEAGGANGIRDFIDAVKQGPAEVPGTAHGLCARILDATKRWRQIGAPDFPPYIATLALFVLAASYDGDEESESHSYHKRLRELLGEPESYQPISKFYDCISVWDDLETWTSHDKAGALGVFRVEFSGPWMFVGIPISQTLLTEKERSSLPEVFSAAGLDPSIQYSDAHIASEVVEHGRGFLLKRTIRRLNREGGANEGLREVLLERLHEELAQWEFGDSEQEGGKLETAGKSKPTRVLVSLQYHQVSRTVETRLYFDGRGLDADSSFQLKSARTGKDFTVEVERRQWSQPLLIGNNVAQATELDWQQDDELKGVNADLKFVFVGGKVRIFESGSDGPGNLIERGRLPVHGAFWLAVIAHSTDVIEWGQKNCRGWQEVRVDAGLPRGWRLFKAEEAITTIGIEKKFPSLCLPSFARIILTGGLKLGKTSRYLSSSPPQVLAQTPPGDFSLTCNDVTLPICSSPVSVPAENLTERNIVELRAADDPDKTRKCSFYLVSADSLPWKAGLEFGYSARNGSATDNGGARISGALVLDWEAPLFPVRDAFDSDAVTLLGRSPGQIASGHDIIEWSPVWIVSKGRNRRVFFCGSTVENSSPEKAARSGDRRAIRKWQEIIYYGRKTIQQPRHRRLAALWTNYINIAKHV